MENFGSDFAPLYATDTKHIFIVLSPKVVVVMHQKPDDADAMGSSLGWLIS